MLTSLFTGISGINANMTELSVIGNNIANSNTVGFKTSRTTFADNLFQSLSGGSSSGTVGIGVSLVGVAPEFTQGIFETTNNGLDLAIDGEGFFIVKDFTGTTFYTRAGEFNLDKTGRLVNPQSSVVQGFLADSTGTIQTSLVDIQLSFAAITPQATQNVTITSNLFSGETVPAAFDVSNPTTTSNFATSITVFDSLGNSHLVDVFFRKSSSNTWGWNAVVPGSDNANSANAEIQASGTLNFNSSGALTSESAITYPTGGFDFSGGAGQNQTVAFDFGLSTAEGGTGLDGTTQYGSISTVYSQSQDGFASGSLQRLSVDSDGKITGVFSNGSTKTMAQIALGDFANVNGIAAVGKALFTETTESGQAIVGPPKTSGRGLIKSSALELSNVDLAQEFVKMITAQRGFQANSRIITTTDEILSELVNLKR